MSVNGPAGTGSGFGVPNGFWVTDLKHWNRSNPSMYLFMNAVSDSVFTRPG